MLAIVYRDGKGVSASDEDNSKIELEDEKLDDALMIEQYFFIKYNSCDQ